MRHVSGSTKPPAGAPQILAPVGVDDVRIVPASPYHERLSELVDRLAGEVVLRHVPGRRVLDLGRGAPRITEWVEARAASLSVIDAIDLGRGATVRVPLPDATFDVVYCLRTLPHLGHDDDSSWAAAQSVMAEVARILAPGGTALCHIDNARSLWGGYHGIRNPGELVERGPIVVDTARGLTRFDTLGRFKRALPSDLDLVDYHGLRIWSALPHTLSIPIVGRILESLEWFGRDRSIARAFGAHLLLNLRRLVQADKVGDG